MNDHPIARWHKLLIKWNEEGKVVEFKVMLRPHKAINLVRERMAAILQARPAQ